jgi:hypothetical protein
METKKSNIIGWAEEERRLDEEWSRLLEERVKEREEGTITPEREAWIHRRVEYIRSVLEPSHYFGPDYSEEFADGPGIVIPLRFH